MMVHIFDEEEVTVQKYGIAIPPGNGVGKGLSSSIRLLRVYNSWRRM